MRPPDGGPDNVTWAGRRGGRPVQGAAMKQSAGTLLYRQGAEGLEVLLVHPSGPYNRRAPVGHSQGRAGRRRNRPGEDRPPRDARGDRRRGRSVGRIRLHRLPEKPQARPLFRRPRPRRGGAAADFVGGGPGRVSVAGEGAAGDPPRSGGVSRPTAGAPRRAGGVSPLIEHGVCVVLPNQGADAPRSPYHISSIRSMFSRRNASHSSPLNTLVVVPMARTQLAPTALARRRQPSASRPRNRPSM